MPSADVSRAAPAGAALAFLLIALLSGCATTAYWPDTAQIDQAPVHQLDNVPFYPQEKYQCGPASLAMMLNTQGAGVTPDDLVGQVYLPERHGSLQVEMVAAARQHGMLVYPLQPRLADILQEIDAGHPVLVLQNLRFGWWPQWHFAVVIGYDTQADEMILHSGTEKAYHEPLTAFMATWDRADNWARVMLPPRELPATAQPLDYLVSANDLETTGQLDAARQAYRTALATWSDQPAALLGLGNIAYRQENWDEAASQYRRLTTEFPRISAGWNNLGEALAKKGCGEAASRAHDCARRLKPERYDEGADAAVEGTSPADCPVVDCPIQ
ncbi:peptidase C39 family protein [Marinobacter halodurans]|uniref:Peptidase C39 family protein n=1 Tax=Marinobacter halodurans TaxID=2528979 RepID=A0ABY1ZPV3_9GAMM|nr:PA2778 family cysteine peptidase [Marinobacter halodurans]TBW58752.1 peptidase C39 family protein [Marinobacter halodurans]